MATFCSAAQALMSMLSTLAGELRDPIKAERFRQRVLAQYG